MKKDILVIGASGLAKEILFAFPEFENRFIFFDNINENIDPFFKQFTIIQNINQLSEVSSLKYFVLGLGGCKNMKKLYDLFNSYGLEPITLIASTTKIGKNSTEITKGCLILDQCLISNNVKIGYGNLINKSSIISHDVKIGSFCEISPSSRILGWVNIGDEVSIGANATILPNISIGSNSIVGAGSVVTKNVPENVVVVGNPAKIIRNNI